MRTKFVDTFFRQKISVIFSNRATKLYLSLICLFAVCWTITLTTQNDLEFTFSAEILTWDYCNSTACFVISRIGLSMDCTADETATMEQLRKQCKHTRMMIQAFLQCFMDDQEKFHCVIYLQEDSNCEFIISGQ
uniref:Uncharacterized protein n=1 Tax=Romanomermis culicivorax TaxID=13658 RepID=A0A915HHD1_ROMCU